MSPRINFDDEETGEIRLNDKFHRVDRKLDALTRHAGLHKNQISKIFRFIDELRDKLIPEIKSAIKDLIEQKQSISDNSEKISLIEKRLNTHEGYIKGEIDKQKAILYVVGIIISGVAAYGVIFR